MAICRAEVHGTSARQIAIAMGISEFRGCFGKGKTQSKRKISLLKSLRVSSRAKGGGGMGHTSKFRLFKPHQ